MLSKAVVPVGIRHGTLVQGECILSKAMVPAGIRQ